MTNGPSCEGQADKYVTLSVGCPTPASFASSRLPSAAGSRRPKLGTEPSGVKRLSPPPARPTNNPVSKTEVRHRSNPTASHPPAGRLHIVTQWRTNGIQSSHSTSATAATAPTRSGGVDRRTQASPKRIPAIVAQQPSCDQREEGRHRHRAAARASRSGSGPARRPRH